MEIFLVVYTHLVIILTKKIIKLFLLILSRKYFINVHLYKLIYLFNNKLKFVTTINIEVPFVIYHKLINNNNALNLFVLIINLLNKQFIILDLE